MLSFTHKSQDVVGERLFVSPETEVSSDNSLVASSADSEVIIQSSDGDRAEVDLEHFQPSNITTYYFLPFSSRQYQPLIAEIAVKSARVSGDFFTRSRVE